MWKVFKVNNEDTRVSFWCLYILWTYFKPYSSVFIVNFEHIIAGLEITQLPVSFNPISLGKPNKSEFFYKKNISVSILITQKWNWSQLKKTVFFR